MQAMALLSKLLLVINDRLAFDMPLTGSKSMSKDSVVLLPEEIAGCRSPEGVQAGVWLYYSQLDKAHVIAQDLHTAEGSFWHGIVHRREPDAFNAGYWFRKVGRHPVFPTLAAEAKGITGLNWGETWDPRRFIEFCEEARGRPGSEMEAQAVAIQLAEWRLLMQYCLESR
jgi:hypothetical protein